VQGRKQEAQGRNKNLEKGIDDVLSVIYLK
jgi:hypothetical protein